MDLSTGYGGYPEHEVGEVELDSAAEECGTIPATDGERDYFVEKDGLRFAGVHLLVEMWGAQNLDDPEAIEAALLEATTAAGATVLHSHLHHFAPSGGVTGVVLLAESHISIHTWPERDFAAIDVFMCGNCEPYRTVPILRGFFSPSSVHLTEHKRGLLP